MTDFRPGRFQVLPPVVKNIIIINVLMVLIQFTLGRMGINLDEYLGMHYWKSPLFRWWQPFTHLFMHGSPGDVNQTLLHIFSNMFALWMFGSILENIWGPRRLIIFYLICGLGAILCHSLVLTYEYGLFEKAFNAYQQNPTLDQYINFLGKHDLSNNPVFDKLKSVWSADPHCRDCSEASVSYLHQYYMAMINEPTVGASGAVMGILFAFGYLFPNTLLYLYFFVPVKAKWFVAGYAVFELYSGIQNSAGDNIAHFAHLGGMLFAFILLRIWNVKNRREFY